MKRLIFPLGIVFAMLLAGCGGHKTKEKPQPLDTSTLVEKMPQEKKERSKRHPGERVYKEYCATCHQADGSGVPGMYPPLSSNEYIRNKDQILRVVLDGMKGKVEIDGEVYNNFMAPHSHLTDLELASVISYVRASFGNSLDPVTIEEVAAARKK